MTDFSVIFGELAKASPYAILLVLAFVLFFYMHKHSIDTIKKFAESTILEIRKAYKEANK